MKFNSAYRFISAPLQNQVFYPEWAKHISFQQPFIDGRSGEIEFEIKANSPVFIRDGKSKQGDISVEFSNYVLNGEKIYFIPATSLKGLVRSTVEIISFSEMNKKLVNNGRFGYRDLTKDSEYKSKYDANKVKAGWLNQEIDGSWKISECSFWHVHHAEIDLALGTNFRSSFLNKQPKEKTAKYKYTEMCKGMNLGNFTFNLDFSVRSKPKGVAVYDRQGESHGVLVLTGQPGPRKEPNGQKPSGKVFEFVFESKTKGSFDISSDLQRDFRFLYSEHDPNSISEDWKFWKNKLNNNEEVPVFFTEENGQVVHFGLSYMYKLPFEKSIHDLPQLSYEQNQLDLAKSMFGYTDGMEGLRGRVMFGPAIAIDPKFEDEVVEILGGPKASFTPYYLKNGTNYNSSTASLKGYKKYPIHSTVKKGSYSADQNLTNVGTTFKPIQANTVFKGKLRYFNLTRVELGALISALTFHNQEGLYFHNIGLAKSMGYGTISIHIKNIDDFISELQVFEHTMNIHTRKVFQKDWRKTDQIREWASVSAFPISDKVDSSLRAPLLEMKGSNEFVEIKKLGTQGYLDDYSEVNGFKEISTLVDSKFLEDINKLEEIENQRKLENEKRFNELIASAHECANSLKFDEARKLYSLAMEIKQDNSLESFVRTFPQIEKNFKLNESFHIAISSGDKALMSAFILNNPNDARIDELRALINQISASTEIPERVKDLSQKNSFENFIKAVDDWKKKMPGKEIKGSAFEDELITMVLNFKQQKDMSKDEAKKWGNGVFKKKIETWVRQENINRIFN